MTRNYQNFITRIKNKLESVEERSIDAGATKAALKAYWEVGRDTEGFHRETAASIKDIAEDSGAAKGTMEKYVRFYKFYPKGYREIIGNFIFQWSHYAALLYVPDSKAREFYLENTAAYGWSSHELRRRIRNNFYETRLEEIAAGTKETPLKNNAQKLYTYAASVKKIVDADTFVLDIDVGFRTTMEHKVRLRGINCPEKETTKGEEAIEFVTQEFSSETTPMVVIRSYKAEKFGRYIVDLWYMKGETDRERIVSEGVLLNQLLLDKKLAVKVE